MSFNVPWVPVVFTNLRPEVWGVETPPNTLVDRSPVVVRLLSEQCLCHQGISWWAAGKIDPDLTETATGCLQYL